MLDERIKSNPISNQAESKPEECIRAVLLTSSGKNGAACVAAFDLSTKQFVRFVSDASTAAGIPFEQIRGLSPLDVVLVEKPQKCPISPQTENVFVKPFGLRRAGKYSGTIEDIRKEVQYPDHHSLVNDSENRLYDVSRFQHSLEIIQVRSLVLKKVKKFDGKLTTRAEFIYQGKKHTDFRVTDFNYDLREQKKDELCIPFANLILSIPKDDYIVDGKSKGYYLFVAAIYPIDALTEEAKPIFTHAAPSNGRQALRDMVSSSRKNSYELWSEQEDRRLLEEYDLGMPVGKIAEKHARSYGAIRSRLRKLGRIE